MNTNILLWLAAFAYAYVFGRLVGAYKSGNVPLITLLLACFVAVYFLIALFIGPPSLI